MDQKTKDELNRLFEAPSPQRKQKFLLAHYKKKISMFRMLKLQLMYISVWNWIITIFILLFTMYLNYYVKSETIQFVVVMMPFLALMSIHESMRSVIYGMNELEMSCRFPLKSIIMARLCILGVGDLILVVLLTCITDVVAWQNAIYMLVTYFITTYGECFILRKIPTKDGIYLCGGYSIFISTISFISEQNYHLIYESRFFIIWIFALLLFITLTIKESSSVIRNNKEYIWN